MKETLKNLLEDIGANAELLAVFLSVFLIEMLIRYFTGLSAMDWHVVVFDLAFSILICGIMLLMGRKTRLVFGIAVFLILGTVAMAQVWHYYYFTDFYSFVKAVMLSAFDTVKGEATGKFSYSLLLFYVPVLVFIIGFFNKIKLPKYRWSRRILISVLFMLLSVSTMGYVTTQYPDNEKDSKSDQYLYSTLYNKVKAMDTFGFYSFEIRDFDLVVIEKKDINEDIEKIRMYIEDNGYVQNTNSYTDMFKGKNIILVLGESLSPGVIDEELTPTLYMMKTEGISFNSNYSPVYQSATADSEFISLTSMIPSVSDQPIAFNYYENSFPDALPNLLEQMGYTCNSFHAYKGYFYNRSILHEKYGFEKLYDWEDFDYSEDMHDEFVEAYNWIPDQSLAKNMVTQTLENDSYPFFDFMISVTGHIPYVRERYELETRLWETFQVYGEPGEEYSEEVLCYFAAQKSLDKAMEELIRDLEEAGKMEDTVIILYGDHYPYGMSEKALKEYYGDTYNTIEMYQTPFIIYTPNMKSRQISYVTSTYDIYPTICNLFGIDINGKLINGSDALDPDFEGTVLFSDYSWLNDEAYYNSTKQTVVKYGSITDAEIEDKTDQVFEEISISQLIIQNDYYAVKTEDAK